MEYDYDILLQALKFKREFHLDPKSDRGMLNYRYAQSHTKIHQVVMKQNPKQFEDCKIFFFTLAQVSENISR